jgi:thiamine biosynthesis lipoprotein
VVLRPQDHEGLARLTEPVRAAAFAMGCRFEVLLAGDDAPRLRAAADDALAEVAALHDRLSTFDPASTVARIGDRAFHEPVPVAGDLFDLLTLCAQVHRDSTGAFDPTIAPLMHLWGFRGAPRTNPPSDAELASARAAVGMHRLSLDAPTSTVRADSPGVRLDLGAVAKGFAIDAALRILREHAVPGALIHAGTSSVGALGAPPGQDAWLVRVRPRAPGPSLVVRLRDRCLGVSEPSGRTITLAGEPDGQGMGGQVLGHVLDPRSGRPTSGADAAIVIADSAAYADAWSTALLVLAQAPRTLCESAGVLRDARWTLTDSHAIIDVTDAPSDSTPDEPQEHPEP